MEIFTKKLKREFRSLIIMETENKCIECGAYHGHSPTCSLMDEKCAKEQLKIYYEAWLKIELEHRKQNASYSKLTQDKINRIKEERDKWKGKFFTVKAENNALRKQILKK